MLSWQAGLGNDVHTAAGSQALYDPSGSSWCGSGCGSCYELTSTGSAPDNQGAGGAEGQSIIVMVTNLCPNNGNAQWCPQPGGKNQYGYEYHFDLMASSSSLGAVLGDNPVVNFTSVACPSKANSDFAQCQCKASTSGSGSGSGTSPAPSPSPSPSKPSSGSGSSGSSSGTAAHWAQCGGVGYQGPTACASGLTCKEQNQWYSQCL